MENDDGAGNQRGFVRDSPVAGGRRRLRHGGRAVTGQLAGALWSATTMPQQWLEKLVRRETIEALVGPLLAVRDGLRIDDPASAADLTTGVPAPYILG